MWAGTILLDRFVSDGVKTDKIQWIPERHRQKSVLCTVYFDW